MTNRLYVIETDNTNPYHNLALEEALLNMVPVDAVILYLWQNRRTVVIGCNQNAYAQCRVEALRADGGYLARRKSGGGAVFHDLGNLNFTFLAQTDNYSVDRQLDVIVRAVGALGIEAARSGRNDITVDGKKFSGNAFFHSRARHLHHGTILVDSRKEDVARYLTVNTEKLRASGVNSVQSRVANLREFCQMIDLLRVKQALIRAAEETYRLAATPLREAELDAGEIARLTDRYSAWEWLYGKKLALTNEFHGRFAWGELQLELRVERGCIQEAIAYTDALDTEFSKILSRALTAVPYHVREIQAALAHANKPAGTVQMWQDAAQLIAQTME